MPIEEKHDKLLDQYMLTELTNYALYKELHACMSQLLSGAHASIIHKN